MRTISSKRLLAIIAVAGALMVTSGISLAQQSDVKRISEGSSDGDRISYVVRCTNKTKGSVYSDGDKPEYCAVARGGKLRCSAKWTLRDASEYACGTSRSNNSGSNR